MWVYVVEIAIIRGAMAPLPPGFGAPVCKSISHEKRVDLAVSNQVLRRGFGAVRSLEAKLKV